MEDGTQKLKFTRIEKNGHKNTNYIHLNQN